MVSDRKPRARRPIVWAMPCAGVVALASACASEATVVTRVVTFNVPAACAVGDQAFGQLYARGDFEPTKAQEQGVRLADSVTFSALSPATRSLTVSAGAPAVDTDWLGETAVAPTGPVDVLLWPTGARCLLSQGMGARDGGAFAAYDGRHALVTGGVRASGVPASYVADLATGAVVTLAVGLLQSRVAPTITTFGDGALVAGGFAADGVRPLDTAEVFATATLDFDGTPVPIGEPRASHGAVTLADGETLLVGGVGASGTPLGSLVVVDPKTRRARSQGLAQLTVPRTRPTVVRLASGEILVAGGLDALGVPVPTLEWLSADASRATKRPRDLVATREHAFVPLPGGGALAVLLPDADGGQDTTTFKNVWIIRADGGLEDATPVAGLTAVRLFAGTEGAPVLFTGDRWLQWRPWLGTFGALARALSSDGPDSSLVASVASADHGLALWVAANGGDARIAGFRFATRGPFVAFPAPLLAPSTLDAVTGVPQFLSPDRLVTPTTTSIRYDARAGLTLAPEASVFVTDATFAGVTATLRVPTGEPSIVVLRDDAGVELEVGGVACPFAAGAFTVGTATTLRVVRAGAHVRVRVGDGADTACTLKSDATARLSLGLRGAAAQPRSVVADLQITRTGS